LSNTARDRLYRRLEKVLITFESIMVALICGFAAWNIMKPQLSKAIFGLTALIVFITVVLYKRYAIKKERQK